MKFTQVQIISDKVETQCPRGNPDAHKKHPGCTFSIGVPRENHSCELYKDTTRRVNREPMSKMLPPPCSLCTINGDYHFPTGFIYDDEISCK